VVKGMSKKQLKDGYIFDADEEDSRKRKYNAKKRNIQRRQRRKDKYKEFY